eukprot:TRINITY_DN9600_c0_g1_i1.p7 TRINITY_DN9600_c0_g1~~TRINITY_DN9600_c0_g1_i1.p7  ORF type:complete len:107 (+),score=3.45 TRINITY_DN9600_c0_g1_i1:94-414(+)
MMHAQTLRQVIDEPRPKSYLRMLIDSLFLKLLQTTIHQPISFLIKKNSPLPITNTTTILTLPPKKKKQSLKDPNPQTTSSQKCFDHGTTIFNPTPSQQLLSQMTQV